MSIIQYKKSITAFIDVLGFSNIVFSSKEEQINLYFSFLKKELKALSKHKSLRSFYISDTIILIGIDTRDALVRTLELIQILQSGLLELNILTRGAITVGDIYLNEADNIIVGPALIKSYQLEKQAHFPRVIIDRSIIPYFDFASTYEFTDYIVVTTKREFAKIVDKDIDDMLYVDYFSHFFSRFQNYTSKGSVSKLLNLIQKQFFSNQHLEKYSWIRDKCIQELTVQIDMQNTINPIVGSPRKIRNRKMRIMPQWLVKFKEV